MRRLLTGCAFGCLVVAAASAQQQPPPTFRGGVSIVTVDVTVLDKDGKPVPGLTADDFQVKLNGSAQPVRTAAYVEAARDVSAPPAATIAISTPEPLTSGRSGRTVTNILPARPAPPPPPVAAAPAGEQRVFVILVDDLSFPATRGKALFAAARRFIDRVPAPDLIGFTTTTGTGTVNPTADRAAVRAALEKVVGQYSDPRFLRQGGPSSGKSQNNNSGDGGPSIDEALDIEGSNPALLKEVIVRECFNNDRLVFNSQTLTSLIASSACASDMVTEARRIAGLTRQNVARQVNGYVGVLKAMNAATGIRHLILLCDGLAVQKETSNLFAVAKAAAEAGVQVSVMLEEPDLSLSDPGRRALGADAAPQADVGQAQRRRLDDKMFIDGAQTVADMTGGVFYRVIGSPDPSFDRIAAASSAVYRLGIEPPANAAPGRAFNLVVSLKAKSGLTIHTNRQAVLVSREPVERKPAFPDKPRPESSKMPPEIQMQVAVQQGKMYSDLPVTAAAMIRRSTSAPEQVDVTVDVEVPGTARGPLSTLLAFVGDKGALKTAKRTVEAPAASGNYVLTFLLPIAAGDYTVRFAAADADGKVGSVQTPLSAKLTPMGAFTVSDLLTWYLDGEKGQLFAIENVPPGVTTLNASLELYPGEGAPPADDVAIEWALLPSGKTAPAAEQESMPNEGQGLLRADASFELADIPAGLYTLRATVTVRGAAIGSTTTTIRKR